jgi:hypothetical protein
MIGSVTVRESCAKASTEPIPKTATPIQKNLDMLAIENSSTLVHLSFQIDSVHSISAKSSSSGRINS